MALMSFIQYSRYNCFKRLSFPLLQQCCGWFTTSINISRSWNNEKFLYSRQVYLKMAKMSLPNSGILNQGKIVVWHGRIDNWWSALLVNRFSCPISLTLATTFNTDLTSHPLLPNASNLWWCLNINPISYRFNAHSPCYQGSIYLKTFARGQPRFYAPALTPRRTCIEWYPACFYILDVWRCQQNGLKANYALANYCHDGGDVLLSATQSR